MKKKYYENMIDRNKGNPTIMWKTLKKIIRGEPSDDGGNENQRLTRQAGNIVLELRKTRSAQKSVFYEEVKMYNSLPANIKQSDRLKTFKHELKEYILSRIKFQRFQNKLLRFTVSRVSRATTWHQCFYRTTA